MASNSNQVLVRKEVPEELTWRLEDIFVTDAALGRGIEGGCRAC